MNSEDIKAGFEFLGVVMCFIGVGYTIFLIWKQRHDKKVEKPEKQPIYGLDIPGMTYQVSGTFVNKDELRLVSNEEYEGLRNAHNSLSKEVGIRIKDVKAEMEEFENTVCEMIEAVSKLRFQLRCGARPSGHTLEFYRAFPAHSAYDFICQNCELKVCLKWDELTPAQQKAMKALGNGPVETDKKGK